LCIFTYKIYFPKTNKFCIKEKLKNTKPGVSPGRVFMIKIKELEEEVKKKQYTHKKNKNYNIN